jgi:hypothetical protein
MDRCYGYKAKDDTNWRASDDHKQAFESALELNDGDSVGAELLMLWLERKTDLLVEKQWPQIERLACALKKKLEFTGGGRFSGDEIDEVLSA